MPVMTANNDAKSPVAVRRVLVVDDEPMVAILLEDALEDFGYQVVGPVENLRSAVQLAATERLDAAIVDINLDGQVSDAVAEKLQARGIPFLFVSGYERNTSLRFSGAPLLRKPFSVEDLHKAIDALLGK